MFTCLQGILPQYLLIGTANWMVSNPKNINHIQNWTANNESSKFRIFMKNIRDKSSINLLFWAPCQVIFFRCSCSWKFIISFHRPKKEKTNLGRKKMPRKGPRSPNFPPNCFQYIECKLRCHHFPTFWWRAVWLFAIVWLWWMIQLHIGLITKCKQSAKLNLQIEWQCLLYKCRQTCF